MKNRESTEIDCFWYNYYCLISAAFGGYHRLTTYLHQNALCDSYMEIVNKNPQLIEAALELGQDPIEVIKKLLKSSSRSNRL